MERDAKKRRGLNGHFFGAPLTPCIRQIHIKKMNINFETAKLSDCNEIHNVMVISANEISRKAYDNEVRKIFHNFYKDREPEYIKKTLEDPNNFTISAKSDGRIIGFIQLEIKNDTGTISFLYMLPGFENKSVGSKLFSIIKKKAIEMKIEKLFVESTLNAVTYYEKLGFVNTGRIPDNSAYNLEMKLSNV